MVRIEKPTELQKKQPGEDSRNEHKSDTLIGIGWKAIIRFVAYLFLMPLALFLAAGTMSWKMAWIYVTISYAFTVISRVLVFRRSPSLLAERARSLDSENVKRWDKAILLFAAIVGPLATYVLAGLDKRFSWSPQLSLSVQLIAVVLVIAGYVIGSWAMAVNKFSSAVVRVQKERNQTVVKNGPYSVVRHPGYAGGILAMIGTPPVLGSLWAYLPVTLAIFLTVVRTALEDKTLSDELEGYREYTKKVRYRLLPGIW